MRLKILNNGYSLSTKFLFAIIRMVSRHPVPDAARLIFYRPDFYGKHMKKLTHEVMRGFSEWSVGDRELMAAFVSKVNECKFCIHAHTATATMAYQNKVKVSAVLSDLENAGIEESLKATLRMLSKLTRENDVKVDDIRAVLSAGVSPEQIKDALAVSFAFNVTDRLANTFGFEVLSPEGFDAGAKFLLKHGYK